MNQIIGVHLFTGTVILAVSFLMKLWPPRKINHFYGYRTPRSIKSQPAWDEANRYSADLMMWAGISTLVIQAICYIFIGGASSILIPLGYYVGFILISIVLTEGRLKSKGF